MMVSIDSQLQIHSDEEHPGFNRHNSDDDSGATFQGMEGKWSPYRRIAKA